MVKRWPMKMLSFICLSVLALSSRFDGLSCYVMARLQFFLSVLALSSRFDGQGLLPV